MNFNITYKGKLYKNVCVKIQVGQAPFSHSFVLAKKTCEFINSQVKKIFFKNK